ncbi:MDR family oxidoreductase [Candidatus Magnetaquicoccus inordinatus]|uniref:acrylyl-CoA reductase (NADPH) n=1 Tax=Candidatus Magnetaquicoccus inordinatus TaxID=2496818 RepID=UPI00102B9A52|nr:MDR family oxidoreductase [Candidatus Magnetaquicoccus inordinatus]
MFKGILIQKDAQGYRAQLQEMEEENLPEGEVLLEIAYSTINYKDALAITGFGPVVRRFPLVPGIDFSGTVLASKDPRYQEGDQVLLNGFGVGEHHWGGLAQRAQVQADWLLPLPKEFSPWQAMAIGTAGYTAMLSILALEKFGVTPEQGEIIVTGAGGGVGGIAVMILAHLGYRVVAASGRPALRDYLLELGAVEIMDRALLAAPGKPLGKERWAGAVDVVGGPVLANVCATTRYAGVVTACGLAGGMNWPATVAPFILRGVTLAGIDSVQAPTQLREEAWRRLARDLDVERLQGMSREISLSEAIPVAKALLEGSVRGRVVVNVNK